MKQQRWLRLHGWLLSALLLALLGGAAWGTAQLPQRWHWGGQLSHTLSPASERLLATLDDEVRAYGFASPGQQLMQRHLRDLLGRYQAASAEFHADFINPEARPDLVRKYGIEQVGEIVLEHAGRYERIQVPSEAHVSAALERLLRSQGQFIAFLSGHGERSLEGEANHDLGAFGTALQRKGYRLQALNLPRMQSIPDNTALLVLTPPQTELLPGERVALLDYLQQGGNLLWLGDPDEQERLEFLADALSLRWLPGVIIDPEAAAALAIDDARLVLADQYLDHPTTARLSAPTLLVQAAAVQPPQQDWDVQPLLELAPSHSLIEHYPSGRSLDAADALLAFAQSRQQAGKQQRVLVVGDGDFLSNQYIGNGANLPLGLNMVDWLTQSEQFLDSFTRPVPDQLIELSRREAVLMASGLLFLLPLVFLSLAAVRWWRRRG